MENFLYQYSLRPYLNKQYSFFETAKYCNNYSKVGRVDETNYDFIKEMMRINNISIIGIKLYKDEKEYIFTDLGYIDEYCRKKYFIDDILIMRIINMGREKYCIKNK